MNTEHNLYNLLSAINVLQELPAMKLAENGNLLKEIRSIVSGKNVTGLIDSMTNDYRREQEAALNSQRSKQFESNEFLSLYARYRGAVYDILRDSQETHNRTQQIIKKSEATAFNSKGGNPFISDKIKSLKETKQFEEAYNSIYSDRSLQIGTPQDPTRISSYIDYSPYTWNYVDYLAIPTLAQTIDLSIHIATSKVPNIIVESNELKEDLEKYFKRSKFNDIVRKMLLYSHLSPRGSLIVPIEDDENVRFNVFNDTQFTYSTSYQYSKIDFIENETGVNQLYVLGNLLQNGVTAHFLCPGFEPIYAIGKNRIYQLKDAAEAINIYLYTIKVLCIRAQVIVQSYDGNQQNDTMIQKMKNLTNQINSNLSLSTAINKPDGSTVDILNNNLSEGFAKISPVIKEYQGMLSGIMPDRFYGSDTAYNANTFNVRATNQNIRSQVQEPQIEPIYRFVINKLIELHPKFQKYDKYRDDFDIDFESLYEPDAKEQEEINAAKIENIIKMADYPELQKVFKDEGLLKDHIDLPKIDDSDPKL